ncbi:MAG: PIN domain-containing protein [Candidatus Delongbacteria bacterium]|nr:PIN domain-containing protein [Candidatus Delongbacteria bacterium]MCG2760831.1 PIN domain-containing protein [Candidatus Delongbacteria bacterium]
MKKLNIYLDTSVINHLFADDAPEAKLITKELFEKFIKNKKYNTYISPIVINEINQTTSGEKKSKLLSIISEYDLIILDIETDKNEIESIAQGYLEQGILPRKSLLDALHIAVCTYYEIDALVSWNYKHMANINRERKIISWNIGEGYTHNMRICTPMEVIYENE